MAILNFPSNISGLTSEQVLDARATYGYNEMHHQKQHGLINAVLELLKEPMFLLLLAAAVIYFISGEIGDGIFMLSAIVIVASISLYQDYRSRIALETLQNLTQPVSKVIRNGTIAEIKREEVVVGDYLIVEEGMSVPADGIIIHSNDFSVNESLLTGESLPVSKSERKENNVYQGTYVVGGLAICKVVAIGSDTELGKIGKSLQSVEEEKTPLQVQITSFVKKMALAGAIIFLFVWGINYMQSGNMLNSLLKALTLAMSIVPEEIPVAFTTFMALGAWRLSKMGIIVKNTKTVETLGSATIICTDKTGTITQNKMSLAKIFVLATNKIISVNELNSNESKKLIALAMWASEPMPFDPMDIALHEAYRKSNSQDDRTNYKMIHEYPLSGTPPMMTHVFENTWGNRVIAVKGAPEAVTRVSTLSESERRAIGQAVEELSKEGFRVLGVGESYFDGDQFPKDQHELKFTFTGLVAFYDPPKENINSVFDSFYKAGIDVKILTGDNASTTSTIARQTGFRGADKAVNGEELLSLSDEEIKRKVMEVNIFTRMFPNAKLKILNALKANGQVVAMTGDGVNDGPALKAAHIGIAMGKKGSEVAKEASSLILTDDDLARMVDAVAMGRKIYSNLKRAIQYIISIHIPIILAVFIPLVLGWAYPSIFSPIHIIFFELIMGPTCSIIYENEPLEKNAMLQKPRPFTTTFFKWNELGTSIIQGLVITFGVLFVYQYAVNLDNSESVTRTMVFVTLITANIFLTLVNRSFYYPVLTTLSYKNNLVPLIITITGVLMGCLIYIPAVAQFFGLESLSISNLLISIGVGFISVIWFEAVKAFKRMRSPVNVN